MQNPQQYNQVPDSLPTEEVIPRATLLLGAAHASFMPPHMRGLLLLALIAECRDMDQDQQTTLANNILTGPQPDLDDHHDIDNGPGLD